MSALARRTAAELDVERATLAEQVEREARQIVALLDSRMSLDEIATAANRAEALRVLARKAGVGLEAQNAAAYARLRVEREGGKMLADMVSPGNYSANSNTPIRLSDLGLSRVQSSRWQMVAGPSDDVFEAHCAEVRSAGKEISQAGVIAVEKHRRREAEKERREQDRAEIAPATARLVHTRWEGWLPRQEPADLLLTDPPYSTDIDDIETFAADWLPIALDRVKPTGRAYVCIGAYPDELAAYLYVKTPAHLIRSQVLVWTYRNTLGPSPTYDYKLNWQAIIYWRGTDAPPLDSPEMVEQFSVQDLNAPDGRHGDRWHAWQKPDALAERLIRHATTPGQLVIDPFAGTGTFLLAAARLGREARGCEPDPDMLAIARDRGCK